MGALHGQQYDPVVAQGSTYCVADIVVLPVRKLSLTTLPDFRKVKPVLETHLISLDETHLLIKGAAFVGSVKDKPVQTLGARPGDNLFQ